MFQIKNIQIIIEKKKKNTNFIVIITAHVRALPFSVIQFVRPKWWLHNTADCILSETILLLIWLRVKIEYTDKIRDGILLYGRLFNAKQIFLLV